MSAAMHDSRRPLPRALASLLLVLVLAASPWAISASAAEVPEVAVRCPVPLLEVVPESLQGEENSGQQEGLRLVESGLQYLASLRPPLHVVPALGVYRGGKSLLLDRLMGLRAPYAGGFGVGHGQQTFTRGVEICAEEVDDLGTVVWMDTEGLFSSEDARSAIGPKIFSLALLFSSSVILNSVKVLNDQFFAFFSEQQQVARVLKQGLADQGLPLDTLLPGNLSVFWVLQQPIQFDGSGEASRQQLETFLALPGDESRSRVKRDFRHLLHEVPTASHDVRLWGKLDNLTDEELLPEYLTSTSSLREALMAQLRTSRPMQAASVAAQLKMYVDLVRTERFSGTLAKEAFEEAEIGALCGAYAESLETRAGPLPVASLGTVVQESLGELEQRRSEVVETFHLGTEWSRRLDACLKSREKDLLRRNSEQVLARWKAAAGAVAEEGGCFFLGGLARKLREYAATYGPAFDASLQAQAVDYASALQRTRLVECVRLRDLLWPFAPWLLWPTCSIYLRTGLVSGVVSMALHVVVLAGIYMVLQILHQLPPYLDVDYPILRAHPSLLDLVMRAPPLVPWGSIARAFGFIGFARSCWKLMHCLLHLSRPAGQGHAVGQLVNLELKVNMLLRRSEAMFKLQLKASALESAALLERGDARGAARTLLKGLCLVAELGEDDRNLTALLDAQLRKKACDLVGKFRLPAAGQPDQGEEEEGKDNCRGLGSATKLEEKAASSDLEGLVGEMIRVLEILPRELRQNPRQLQQQQQPNCSSSSQRQPAEASGQIAARGVKPARRRPSRPTPSPVRARTGVCSPSAARPAPPLKDVGEGSSPVLRSAGSPPPSGSAPCLWQSPASPPPPLPHPTAAANVETASTTECESEPEPAHEANDDHVEDAPASVPCKSADKRSPSEAAGSEEEEEEEEEQEEPEDGERVVKKSLWGLLLGAQASDEQEEEDEEEEDEGSEDAAASEVGGEETQEEGGERSDEYEEEEDQGVCHNDLDGDVGEESQEVDAEHEEDVGYGSKAGQLLRASLWAFAVACSVVVGCGLAGGALAMGHAHGLLPA